MIKARAHVTACNRTVLDAFHDHGIWFHTLAERCILSKEDRTNRLVWAFARKRRSKQGWQVRPHATIDNKKFQVYANRQGRQHAARRGVRGAYKKRGTKPYPWLVRPKGSLKFPAKGVQVTAAVIKGKIRMWEYHSKGWNAKVAAAMYTGPLLKALRRAFPTDAANPKCRWEVLEDNDPSGYKTKQALAAKARVRIRTDDLPKRLLEEAALVRHLYSRISSSL